MERTSAASAIGYQVRKDIRNRPYREIDRGAQRRMWGAGAVAVFVLALLMTATRIKVLQTDIDYEIAKLQAEHQRLVAEERHWRAEIATLVAPSRISTLAIERLNLVKPGHADVVVIERAPKNQAPSSAVVAKR
jgi:cell division protein FtsL